MLVRGFQSDVRRRRSRIFGFGGWCSTGHVATGYYGTWLYHDGGGGRRGGWKVICSDSGGGSVIGVRRAACGGGRQRQG